MFFTCPEIIIDESPLKRRILGFCLLDHRLLLDYDIDKERETKSHKFNQVRVWRRLDQRNNTMKRRDVPLDAIDEALAMVRDSIKYELPHSWMDLENQ